jgi:hypothetical protein
VVFLPEPASTDLLSVMGHVDFLSTCPVLDVHVVSANDTFAWLQRPDSVRCLVYTGIMMALKVKDVECIDLSILGIEAAKV